MNFTRRFALAPMLAALALAGSAGSALATNPSRDMLAASTPVTRTDVRAACADLDQHLQQTLVQLRQRTGLNEDMTVRFVVDGTEVRNVEVSGAVPMEARNAVRRAMRQLSCGTTSASTAPQSFSFVLSMSDRASPTPALSTDTRVGLATER